MKQYDLFQIDETRREDKTGENVDNTLIRYFFPEDINTGTKIQSSNLEMHNISEEKIEKSLRQPIKLRNALKQCYWDRNCSESQNIYSQNHYIISVDQVLPKFNFTLQIQTEIQNYILNDFYDVYNGKLKSYIEKENKLINFTGIDMINSQSFCKNFENNLVLNPKRTSNKNEIKNLNLNYFRSAVIAIKRIKNGDVNDVTEVNKYPDKNSSSLFSYNFYFNREKTSDNSYKVNGKVYCIFPNINLELKKINKIPISRSVLSKYLVNGGRLDKLEKIEAEQLRKSDLKNGFIAMSSKHRLITLQNTVESKKEILFGIWLNLSEEKINKNSLNDEMLNKILLRYSTEIYEKCLNFLIMSKKIEMINSPSPDEGIFLMCLFLNGAQYFYEVKSLPNEKEKFFVEGGNKTCLSNFSNEWLIVKKNFKFENFSNKNSFLPQNKLINDNFVIKFDFTSQSQNKIKTAKEYFKKKYLFNAKDSNRDSRNINQPNITTNKGGNINSIGLNCDKVKSNLMNYKDQLNEIFEEGELEKDKDYLRYDFPLSIPKKQSKISNEIKSANYLTCYQPLDNLKKGIPPKSYNNKTIKENSSISRTNNLTENETRLRENLLVRKNSNSHLQQNINTKNEVSNKYIPNNSRSQSNYNEENQSQTIISKGYTDNSVLNNNKLPSSFHRPGNEPSNLNTIETQNSLYFNHKKHMSNDVGYHTTQNFFPNRISSLEINKQIDVGKSIQIVQSNILSPIGNNTGNLIQKPSFDKFETISHGNESNMQNAYDIIYDQAKSIQFLQEQVVKLQTELSFVVDKLRTQDDKEKNSLICSCGGKTSNEKQNVISTGTNTSIEIQNFNAGFNNFPSYENNNRSNSNSLKSNNNNLNNASRPSIKNFNEMENTTNILSSQNNPTQAAFKSEDDYRYENFLNENSINFPKQFLDIDTKHYDSIIKEESANCNQTNNNTQLNQNSNFSSNAYANVIDKNYKLMNKGNNSNEMMLCNRNNKLESEIRNVNNDTYLIDESINYKNSASTKDKAIKFFKGGLNSYQNIIPNFNQNNERPNIATNTMRLNLDNIDITTTSIDPPSYRYVLKVPSIVGKSINSFAYDDQNQENVLTKKSLDTTRGNDYTINLPRIIFNESIESYEENDGE